MYKRGQRKIFVKKFFIKPLRIFTPSLKTKSQVFWILISYNFTVEHYRFPHTAANTTRYIIIITLRFMTAQIR